MPLHPLASLISCPTSFPPLVFCLPLPPSFLYPAARGLLPKLTSYGFKIFRGLPTPLGWTPNLCTEDMRLASGLPLPWTNTSPSSPPSLPCWMFTQLRGGPLLVLGPHPCISLLWHTLHHPQGCHTCCHPSPNHSLYFNLSLTPSRRPPSQNKKRSPGTLSWPVTHPLHILQSLI